jgi:sialate O-acetylesterase
MKIENGKIEIKFTSIGGGLMSRDGKSLTWFSVAGADGKYYPAQAEIVGNKVLVSAPEVSAPVNVRFAWNEAAQSNFVNKEGLPAVPFRSDNPWEKVFR